jgi:hypothetical protein
MMTEKKVKTALRARIPMTSLAPTRTFERLRIETLAFSPARSKRMNKNG